MNANDMLQDKIRTFSKKWLSIRTQSRINFFSSLSIPSYLRDWIAMRFSDDDGKLNLDEVRDYIKNNIPTKNDWELLKSKMINDGQRVKFLAKIRVEIDVRTGHGVFKLPDLGFPNRKYEAIVKDHVLYQNREELLNDSETWGSH